MRAAISATSGRTRVGHRGGSATSSPKPRPISDGNSPITFTNSTASAPTRPAGTLFTAAAGHRGHARRRRARPDRVTKDLTAIGAWLDAQLIQIRAGGPVAARPLLGHGRTLVRLLRRDREALLYAASGLNAHPPLVQHGMAVAIRLADLLEWQGRHTQPLDGVIACALIHDFGKALLPEAVRHAARPYNADQRATLATHVRGLTERLHEQEYLPPDVVAAVIGQANERLDGSGYPHALIGDDLPELARIMAVVDVADAMRRDRADRKAWPQVAVYKHMLQSSPELDNRWVQRYIRRFGVTPVGSLARYSGGVLAWIQRLDRHGKPIQAKMAMNLHTGDQRVGKTVHESDLTALGQIEALVEPQEYGLIAQDGIRCR